jgi:hypothetical protein
MRRRALTSPSLPAIPRPSARPCGRRDERAFATRGVRDASAPEPLEPMFTLRSDCDRLRCGVFLRGRPKSCAGRPGRGYLKSEESRARGRAAAIDFAAFPLHMQRDRRGHSRLKLYAGSTFPHPTPPAFPDFLNHSFATAASMRFGRRGGVGRQAHPECVPPRSLAAKVTAFATTTSATFTHQSRNIGSSLAPVRAARRGAVSI